MRKFILLTTFFAITPFLLIFSIVLFSVIHFQSTQSAYLYAQKPNAIVYAALPTEENVMGDEITTQNAQVEIVKEFFEYYHSPLMPYAQNIVDEANAFHIDYRLLPAIAMQESNLCAKAPPGSFNCWGYGIYGKTVKTFPDYETAIHVVTEGLAKNYIGKGLTTPDTIMPIYTPQSHGSWASSVNHFMNQIE